MTALKTSITVILLVIKMARRIRTPFAENGDRTAIQDVPPADGTVNYETGYTPQYSLDIVSDPTARRVNRDRFNQLMHDITSNIQEWQNQLFPSYVPPTSNGNTALSYSRGMIVTFNNTARVSLVDNNTTQPDSSSWADAFPFPIGLGGTGALNASDARTNLGIQAASTVLAGLIRIATQQEANDGSVANAVITPQTLGVILENFSPGAVGGGNDSIFWENDQVVTRDYTITASQNAMTAGPVNIGKPETTITSISSDGTNITVTSSAHGLIAGDPVSISGTTNYNGDYTVGAVTNSGVFTITNALNVATETTGTVANNPVVTVPDGQDWVVV